MTDRVITMSVRRNPNYLGKVGLRHVSLLAQLFYPHPCISFRLIICHDQRTHKKISQKARNVSKSH